MESLLKEIRACKICHDDLELGANPVLSATPQSRFIIIGQAPGTVVHRSGVPWEDKSGDRLREWLGVDKAAFYNPDNFALIPMGFCYPGKGKSGDLPPRKECAPQWHAALLSHLSSEALIILVGSYAQKYYLGESAKSNLTVTVQHFEEYLPKFFPLPHPSPRNNIWLKKNPWFDQEVTAVLKRLIGS